VSHRPREAVLESGRESQSFHLDRLSAAVDQWL